jgi:enoyl-CoA hydratase
VTAPLLYEKQDAIAYITINRPEARNALSPEVVCRFADAVLDYAKDDSLRAAIITGAGDKAFCAGGDLGSMLPLLTGAREPENEWDRRVLTEPVVMAASALRDFDLPKPVIAAINGFCFAAGAELILGTDIRIAASHATFAFPEVKRGLIPFAGSTVRLARQIPQALALELMLTGDPIDAATANRIGLVNHVVPAVELMDRAKAIARNIAANGPFAVQRIKETVLKTSGLSLSNSYVIEDLAKDSVFDSEDAKEGPRSFMEKRAPRFSGR